MGYQDQPVREIFGDSDRITALAATDITGKTFVTLTTGSTDRVPRIVTAAAGARPYGVAGWSVSAGERVTVYRRGIVTVTAGAALTAGAGIAAGTDGKAVTVAAEARDYGVVHEATATNEDAAVALSI